MDTLTDPAAAQAHINEIQQLYREWIELQPKLEAGRRDWQRSAAIMRQLEQFYFEGGFARYHQAIENGLDIDLRTQGEYSVMGEDTLWNAFSDQQTLAWQWLRAAIAVLDRGGEEEEAEVVENGI
ncbi:MULTISPECIES: DUF4298 domain-containing protein [unclassified Neisseria]|uniref:DUF4298 domain-containing protein n=1 Tax=unclassified Neisseria TaxID=2623750 RepID=UPI00107173DC|nr:MULTISPECIES: DUF4298 domain-containing protein [unclassified Neisseria]MBF0804225.1 DUF4298 domain-containing protein [Neisseria sp. 19428wB4_WF04]TFU43018.1 DUF4298 domain-containing protein [Neisseria sp. WF04]TFV06948.1 DUF4298 domain-containing protein [Bacillus stratosphericus]